jgi:hypothetical protein
MILLHLQCSTLCASHQHLPLLLNKAMTCAHKIHQPACLQA